MIFGCWLPLCSSSWWSKLVNTRETQWPTPSLMLFSRLCQVSWWDSLFDYEFWSKSPAYGTVGLTTGLPDHAYSFSGGWHVCSKLILAFVMLQGRHRGLPVAIDRAVLLPGYPMQQLEEEDAQIHAELHRSMDVREVWCFKVGLAFHQWLYLHIIYAQV